MLLGYLIFLILVKRFDVKLVNNHLVLTDEILDKLIQEFRNWKEIPSSYPLVVNN